MKKLASVGMILMVGILSVADEPLKIKAPGQYAFGTVAFKGNVDSCKGISEDALLFKASCAAINMKNFPVEKGSLSFWVSPKEWHGQDGQHHIFLRLRFKNPKRELTIYRYANPNRDSTGLGLCLLFHGGSPQKNIIMNMPNNRIGDSWKKDSWHCIVYNFDAQKNQSELYIDDELISLYKQAPLLSKEVVMELGTSWGSPAATLLDRIVIRPEPMNREQIASEYELGMAAVGEK